MKKTETEPLAKALFILACEIQSSDGVANAAIREAAQTLLDQHQSIVTLTAQRDHLNIKTVEQKAELKFLQKTVRKLREFNKKQEAA